MNALPRLFYNMNVEFILTNEIITNINSKNSSKSAVHRMHVDEARGLSEKEAEPLLHGCRIEMLEIFRLLEEGYFAQYPWVRTMVGAQGRVGRS